MQYYFSNVIVFSCNNDRGSALAAGSKWNMNIIVSTEKSNEMRAWSSAMLDITKHWSSHHISSDITTKHTKLNIRNMKSWFSSWSMSHVLVKCQIWWYSDDEGPSIVQVSITKSNITLKPTKQNIEKLVCKGKCCWGLQSLNYWNFVQIFSLSLLRSWCMDNVLKSLIKLTHYQSEPPSPTPPASSAETGLPSPPQPPSLSTVVPRSNNSSESSARLMCDVFWK